MKKNWNNPELKNLTICKTNEDAAPYYFEEGAPVPCLCKWLGGPQVGQICHTPGKPCGSAKLVEKWCGAVKYWICEYAEPTVTPSA